MKIVSFKTTLALISNVLLLVALVLPFNSCVKNPDEGKINPEDLVFEVEEYTTPTEDAVAVTSQLPAYVFPYDYKGFGEARINRLQNRVAELGEDTAVSGLATVVLHSSQIEDLEEWDVILVQLLLGRNIIIVEPTIESFNSFCEMIAAIYLFFTALDEGQEFLSALEIVPGARQTLEAFYEMGVDSSKVESMFLLDTDPDGIFAEAIAVRGCDFHIVDRVNTPESTITHEQIGENGEIVPADTPNIDSPAPSDEITPYSYGLFADMFTKWVNEQKDYIDLMASARNRGVQLLGSRATEATKLSLEEICTVQKVQYTMSEQSPYSVGPSLPITITFEVCSIYMEKEDCDYYCVNKTVLAYNQMLDCGPTEPRKWRQHGNFGYEEDGQYGPVYYTYKYYGPFMRDIECRSICHAHTDNFIDSTTTAVDLPNAKDIVSASGVSVEKYSPMNSIGSVDQTNGFSYGFDGGLYLAKEPSVNLGFSVSFDSSTTQTIDDLEIVASSINGLPEWKYIGQNLPDAYYNLVKETSHSEAPSIMRRECEVNQSWIWRVPNPEGSYRLFDETMVATSIMYFDIGFFKAYSKFANHATTKRTSFLMMPPPRSEQLWMMNVAPYSDALNSMLATTHSRFWKKDDHEFVLTDSSADSRLSIEQFVHDFQRDLNNKRHTWKNRNFLGEYTFSYYNVDDATGEPISFKFVVE